jgi:hypothetical protein
VASDARYVLVKGDLGLGNRMLCLLSALLLARLTARRLLVDWRDPFYANDGADARPGLLHSDRIAPLTELPDTDSVAPAVWRGRLHEPAVALRPHVADEPDLPPFLWQRYSVSLATLDHPQQVIVFTSFFEQIDALRPYLTGPLAALRRRSTAEILRDLWRSDLALAPALQERVDSFRQSAFTRPTVGVHVRASDLRTRAGAIEAATAAVLRRHPGTRVFLATDNQAVLRRYQARFPDVVSTDKWYPPAGEPMHIHPARPDAAAGAAAALVDLHLLAGCDRLIVDSRSSFGRLAALRSRAPARHVIDVHPGRFLPLRLRRRLLPLTSLALRWTRRLRPRPAAATDQDGQSPIA